MDQSWSQLQNLEAHIKEHNTHIEKLTPMRTRHHSRQSSAGEEIAKKVIDTGSQQKMMTMAKELKEKEREMLYLKKNVASLEIYKDQCNNMKSQIKLLREKAVICEREAQNKSSILAGLETTTVPKAKKLENDLREALQMNEKLQKTCIQIKKESEEKFSSMSSLKQSYVGQDSIIKTLEEEKRNLRLKLSEIQGNHEELLKQYEKNTEHLKNKDQLTLALEEDNERLRAQIEKTMESLQKCQYELGLLPKLRQEIHQREQLISAASREIEKEKSNRVKALEEKEKLEIQLGSIIDYTEGNNPIDYIQELKSLLNKSTKEHAMINEELMNMKQKQKHSDIESTQTLQNIVDFLDSLARSLPERFLSAEIINFPDLDDTSQSILGYFCEQLLKCQQDCIERVAELQETNGFLKDRVNTYEKNTPLREKIEKMEKMIKNQETIWEEITKENSRLKEDLELKVYEIDQSGIEKQQLSDEIETLKAEIEKLDEYTRESLVKMHYSNWEEGWGIGDAMQFIINELSLKLESNKKLNKGLEEYKGIVDNIAKKHQIEKEGFEKATSEYLTKMQDMGQQVENLTVVIDESERNLKDTLERYNASVNIIREKNRDCQQLEQACAEATVKLQDYMALTEFLSRAFSPLIRRNQSLRWQKFFLSTSLNSYESLKNKLVISMSRSTSLVKKPRSNKLRISAIALIFALRLKKLYTRNEKCINIEGIPIHLANVIPSTQPVSNKDQFLSELLQPTRRISYKGLKLKTQQYDCTSEQLRILEGLDHMQEKMSRQSSIIRETNEKLQKVINIRGEHDEEMTRLLAYCKDLEKTKAELVENLENSENHMYAHSERCEKLEQELLHYKSILTELQDAANELQEYVKVLSAQRSELQQENQLKAETILSLQQVVEKLKTAFLSNTDNSEEVQQVIELLSIFTEGYENLERKIERHFSFSEEILQKLKLRSLESESLNQCKLQLKRCIEEIEFLNIDNEALRKKLSDSAQDSSKKRQSSPESSQVVQLRSTSSFIPLS